ncbi:MAG: CBS domain-containing protein [Deltaproteobacteria bacterium]|nr:CBS domain-containing protein [Deltaproteobacteria bacterium]
MNLDANLALANTLRDCMMHAVTTLTPSTSLDAATKLFAEQHITGAPVVNGDCQCVGVISQTDLLNRRDQRSREVGDSVYFLVLHGELVVKDNVAATEHPSPGIVADLMTREVISIDAKATLRDAIERMTKHHVHRLVVLENGKLSGVITSMDVLRLLSPTQAPRERSGF